MSDANDAAAKAAAATGSSIMTLVVLGALVVLCAGTVWSCFGEPLAENPVDEWTLVVDAKTHGLGQAPAVYKFQDGAVHCYMAVGVLVDTMSCVEVEND